MAYYVREQRREQGLCIYCGSHPSMPGIHICEKCKQYNRIQKHERYLKNIQEGRCPKCGRPKTHGEQTKTCKHCLDYGRNSRRVKDNAE